MGIGFVLVVIIALATGYYFGGNHTAISTMMNNLSNASSTVPNTPISLNLQAQCASQAESALTNFEQQMGNGYSNYAQQNHYNSSLEKCFVLISYSPNVPAGTQIDTDAKAYEYPTNIETFEDAYENSDLADCIYYGDLIGVDHSLVNSNPESATSCSIGNNKATYQQYKDFVSQRMALNE